jgi:DNA-binding CsgD family transcriptional regulator
MSLLRRLLNILGLHRESAPHQYQQVESFHNLIAELAQQEQRPEAEIHASLLAEALAQRNTSQDLWQRWQSLSPREQEVAAFTCFGYTNNQIAIRLGLSVETVKTHVGNLLVKFGLHSKVELRLTLSEWDFRDWVRNPHI